MDDLTDRAGGELRFAPGVLVQINRTGSESFEHSRCLAAVGNRLVGAGGRAPVVGSAGRRRGLDAVVGAGSPGVRAERGRASVAVAYRDPPSAGEKSLAWGYEFRTG